MPVWTVCDLSWDSRECALLLLSCGPVHVVRRFVRHGAGRSFFCFVCPLDGTFLRLSLDLASDQLYDLALEIPDVMGFWVRRASAAIVKVFPRASCAQVRMCAVDSNFSRASCTPVEMCARLIRNFSGRAFRRVRFAWKDRII